MSPWKMFSVAYLLVSILPLPEKGKKFATISLFKAIHTLLK